MAYDWEKIEKEAIEIIEQEKLTFFDDLCLYLEPSRCAMYLVELNKVDAVKQALKKNKIAVKKKLRNRWEESDAPVLQIAAYKLIADDDEIEKLTTNSNKNHNSGEVNVNWKETKTYESQPQTDPRD